MIFFHLNLLYFSFCSFCLENTLSNPELYFSRRFWMRRRRSSAVVRYSAAAKGFSSFVHLWRRRRRRRRVFPSFFPKLLSHPATGAVEEEEDSAGFPQKKSS